MLRHKWFCPPFNFFDEGIEQDGWAARLKLLQLGVFGFGGCEDGDPGVGVFPEREEILIRYACLGWVALEGVGARQAQLR